VLSWNTAGWRLSLALAVLVEVPAALALWRAARYALSPQSRARRFGEAESALVERSGPGTEHTYALEGQNRSARSSRT
jgi:hypothetical protein